LYEHARALGIIGPEDAIGKRASSASEPVVELASYRKSKASNE
jgi:hypothetical protein